MEMLLNKRIVNILYPAFSPCANFPNTCEMMHWNPAIGHVPRGFTGATGLCSEVRLVLVGAEPGNPHSSENHLADGNPIKQMESTYRYTWECFENGKDIFHRNVRLILDKCFPNMSFREQMKYTWITDSVLCSASIEGGFISNKISDACCKKYLLKEINLFENSIVVALGRKADSRLKNVGFLKHIHVFAAAPPGCNYKGAKESWEKIVHLLK